MLNVKCTLDVCQLNIQHLFYLFDILGKEYLLLFLESL